MQTSGFVRGNTRNKWPAQIVEMELKFFVFHFNEYSSTSTSTLHSDEANFLIVPAASMKLVSLIDLRIPISTICR